MRLEGADRTVQPMPDPTTTKNDPKTCPLCLQEPTPEPHGVGTGWATLCGPLDPDSNGPDALRACYACADRLSRLDLARAKPGEPVPVAVYLSTDGTRLTTWTGGLLATVSSRMDSGNRWAARGYDGPLLRLRAVDPMGRLLLGTGRRGMYARLRVAKTAPTVSDLTRRAAPVLPKVA